MSDQRLEWVASVGCDGGPVLVVDRAAFGQWTGAEPFARIASRDAAAAERSSTLHYWGQFSHRLPAPFTAHGGHRYVQCATAAEARAKLDELRAAVLSTFPAAHVWTEGADTHFELAGNGGGAPRMTAQLSPASEYDASWQSHPSSESWLYAFGQGAQGLFWDLEGAGVADVAVRSDGNEVVLVRSWPSGDDEDAAETAAMRALVARALPEEEVIGELTLAGRTVIVWGPMALPLLADPALLDGRGTAMLDAERIDGIGAAIDVTPGRYRITTWSTDESELDEPWSCRWCRLTRIA